ncbi:MAG: O-antigen ligase family protein [Candidatus Gracilibacteria bacterium]|nr:O-antigen ligase family protein [Candidatus Gracilibacteria bacterium]
MNTFFSRLIFLLFLLVPLVFISTNSPTILTPFVVPGYHYESVKVLVFFILGALLCITSLLSWGKKENTHRLSRTALLGIALLIMSTILSTVFSEFPTEALWGSSERRHGVVLYGSLVLLYLLLQQRMSPEIRTMGGKGIFIGFILLSGYALIQACGFGSTLSNGDLIISSTLGNSAYLAGYALILLPGILMEGNSRWFQYTLGTLAIATVLATESLSAVIIAILYLLYLGFRDYKKSRTGEMSMKLLHAPLFLLSFIILLGSITFFSPASSPLSTKVQNFETRIVLWHETLGVWKQDPLSMAFGNGADTLGNFLELQRSDKLRMYIPDVFYIDRAHNIFLDILFSFGIMGLLAFLIPVWMLLSKRIHHPGAHVILLFFAFFSFNIPVISHWLIFIFALSTIKKKE